MHLVTLTAPAHTNGISPALVSVSASTAIQSHHTTTVKLRNSYNEHVSIQSHLLYKRPLLHQQYIEFLSNYQILWESQPNECKAFASLVCCAYNHFFFCIIIFCLFPFIIRRRRIYRKFYQHYKNGVALLEVWVKLQLLKKNSIYFYWICVFVWSKRKISVLCFNAKWEWPKWNNNRDLFKRTKKRKIRKLK